MNKFDVYIRNASEMERTVDFTHDGMNRKIVIRGDCNTFVRLINCDESYRFDDLFIPEIKKVIYNPPATVIIWSDNTKTVVKCQEEDVYDKQTGFMLCVIKKIFGNKFNDILRKWVFETADNEDVRDNTLRDYVIFDEFDYFKKAAENFIQHQIWDTFIKGTIFDEERNREA